MQLHDTITDGYFSLSSLQEVFGHQTRPVEYYSIVVVWTGNVSLVIDDEPLQLNKGQVYCISPKCYVSLEDMSGESSVYQFNKQFYCVELHDKEVSCNGLLFNGAFPGPVLTLDEKEERAFDLLHQVFLDELENGDHIQAEMVRVLLKRLIIKCARIAREQLNEQKQMGHTETDLLRDFNALLEKHYKEWHKVQQYADALFKSPKTISNVFKQYGAETPLQLIHNRIVLEARRLLYYTDKTSKEVAYELGFDEPAQFNRLFKKLAGLTPTDFRTK